LGGRVDGDVVYATSTLSPASQGQPAFQCVLGRELHRLRRAGLLGLSGAQQIIWGEVVGFFADVVPARDMREFLLPRFDVTASRRGRPGPNILPATRTSNSFDPGPDFDRSASPVPISTRYGCHHRAIRRRRCS
jgi:hypothetical protein